MRQAIVLLFAVFLGTGLSSRAQTITKPLAKNFQRCYTTERMNQFRRTHPNAETVQQFETWLAQKIKARRNAQQRPLADYIIPVIFHVIHNGEAVGTSPNLDAGYIQEQLLQLNKDFANASNSPYPVAAAAGIQFVMAQNGPSATSLAEPGIERINRNDKGWSDYNSGWDIDYIDATVKPASIWDPNNYLNVWILPQFSTSTTDLLGFSTVPSSSTLEGLNDNETSTTAGIVILTRTVGSAFVPQSCDVGYGQGKTLTHEAGHFFGLRHIWGDEDCGTDFCDDTPVHFTLNNGVPTHPKPNQCGTPDEMFENYMDYSDDVVLNTFTSNQVERMQTVMVNSPRRLSLTTSSAGGVIVTGSNQISFINCSGNLNVSEKGINASYPRYKDVSLTLNVEDKATGPATVSLSASGTAISGRHYELLTPTVVFAEGDKFKPVNVRIFDNAEVDGDRTIVLNYTISGTGVSAGTNSQSVTFSLFDDDNMRIGENAINLLNEHFESPVGTRGLPSGWNLLTSTNYVNQFVASTNGNAGGSGLAAHITNNITTKPNTYTKGVVGAAVLQTPVIDASSVQALGNLSFRYRVRGLEDNDDAIVTYASAAALSGPFYYYGDSPGLTGYGPYSSNTATIANTPVIAGPSTLENRKFSICFYWETGALTNGSDPGFNVDDVVLSATPFPVETSVSSGYTFDLVAASALNNFKSTNNKAIASILNPSVNINGVKAEVIQAGSGNTPIVTGTGNFLRSQKVFRISTVNASPAVSYQATLFFTAAELAAWGADRLNLKILKVKDGVDLGGTLDVNNAELITPTVSEDVEGGFVSYTGNFTGFSQFMVVSPLTTLPVTFISFDATALEKNIRLTWHTASETNNKGYFVERSEDGVSYKEVGWVNGNGTVATGSGYEFMDNFAQPGINYYYRLRQVDINNRQVYSPVRNARLRGVSGFTLRVSPNPAKGFVNIFVTGSSGKATIELIGASGQKLVQRTGVNVSGASYKLALNGLARGVYTVMVYLPEGVLSKRIAVQ